jgi:hypothetical protein
MIGISRDASANMGPEPYEMSKPGTTLVSNP